MVMWQWVDMNNAPDSLNPLFQVLFTSVSIFNNSYVFTSLGFENLGQHLLMIDFYNFLSKNILQWVTGVPTLDHQSIVVFNIQVMENMRYYIWMPQYA